MLDPAAFLQQLILGVLVGGASAYVAVRTLEVRVAALERAVESAHTRIDTILSQPKRG